MVANLNHYRSMLKPETKMVCMVKASAYGAGSYEIAKTLQEHHADYLAVAVAMKVPTFAKQGSQPPLSSWIPTEPLSKPCSTINWNRKYTISIYSTH